MEISEAVYPEKNEEEVIYFISMHFERTINIGVSRENLLTKNELISLLEKIDNSDQQKLQSQPIAEKIEENTQSEDKDDWKDCPYISEDIDDWKGFLPLMMKTMKIYQITSKKKMKKNFKSLMKIQKEIVSQKIERLMKSLNQ